jgi:type II secretory pathway pseudopilin PulG
MSVSPDKTGTGAKRGGFALVEVLIVAAVIAALVSVLVPSLARARLQAKVMKVRAELYQIALGLETYHSSWKDYPWASSFCFGGGTAGEAYNRLPIELDHHYIGGLGEDLFNPGQKYKYARYVGWNNGTPDSSITIWLPKYFPYDQPDSVPSEDVRQSKFRSGPVEYAVWSVGPGGDPFDTSVTACDIYRVPIPKRTWYSYANGLRGEGVIPFIQTKKQGFFQWRNPVVATRYQRAW